MKLFITTLMLLVSVTFAHATDISFAWDKPKTGGVPTGYRLYYSETKGQYTEAKSIDVGNALIATVPELIPGSTYSFVVKAYNSEGSGKASNEVTHSIPMPGVAPGSSENLRVVVTIDIQVPQAKATKKPAK